MTTAKLEPLTIQSGGSSSNHAASLKKSAHQTGTICTVTGYNHDSINFVIIVLILCSCLDYNYYWFYCFNNCEQRNVELLILLIMLSFVVILSNEVT